MSLKASTNILTEEMSLRKKVELSAWAVNKNVRSYRVIPFMSTLFLIKAKRTSKATIKRYADIVSP